MSSVREFVVGETRRELYRYKFCLLRFHSSVFSFDPSSALIPTNQLEYTCPNKSRCIKSSIASSLHKRSKNRQLSLFDYLSPFPSFPFLCQPSPLLINDNDTPFHSPSQILFKPFPFPQPTLLLCSPQNPL